MKNLISILILFLSLYTLNGQTTIFAPGDPVIGGYINGPNFEEGMAGFVIPGNNWPNIEDPTQAINGVGQKYLNFIKLNAGIIVTPSAGGTVANRIQLWTANDAEPRDPASYEVYGTNVAVSGPTVAMSDFTLISSGPLALPSTRNAGGVAVLDDVNSQTIDFTNSDAYTSYLIAFPTVKDEIFANSMQIAEIQLFNVAPPIPTLGQWGIIAMGLMIFIIGIVAIRARVIAL